MIPRQFHNAGVGIVCRYSSLDYLPRRVNLSVPSSVTTLRGGNGVTESVVEVELAYSRMDGYPFWSHLHHA